MPIIPIHLALALLMGTLFKADRAAILYYLWAGLFLLVVALSVALSADSSGISEANRYASTIGIGLTFVAAVQHRTLATAGALGIALATCAAASISFAEFFNPEYTAIVDQRYENDAIKENVISRVGGLHVNPNTNARIMTFGMFVSCFFLPKHLRLLLCLFVGAAVFTTVSRSGMLTWAIAMVMLTALGQFSSGKAFTKLFGFIGVGALGLLIVTGQVPKVLEATGLEEFMTGSMLDRVSSGFISQESSSTDVRLELVPLAIELYSQNPIFGAGVGQSKELGDTGQGPHNAFLEVAAELGTVGLVVFLFLFLIPILLKSPKAICFITLFAFSCMFGHGILVKATLAFILPTGIVLLSRLDSQQQKARQVRSQKGRRRRRRRRLPQHAAARV